VDREPGTEDYRAAVARHAAIDAALRAGGPNPLPEELPADEWEEHLAAYQEGGPYDCELLQEAENAVETLAELQPPDQDPAGDDPQTPTPPPSHTAPPAGRADTQATCMRIYAESLPDLSEDELRADLDTCLDAGRDDSAFVIRLELERRERETPPPAFAPLT
jgi:hypothetical protein